MSSEPLDKSLYNYVKKLADKKFLSKTGIYKSSWIVKEYKKRGGKYKGSKQKSGLKRWYKEKWVDLNRPIKNSKGKIVGYRSCGRNKVKGSKEKYPLCRPSKKITSKTPRTYKSLSKSSILKAKRRKSKIKHTGNIKFVGGDDIKKILKGLKEHADRVKVGGISTENFKTHINCNLCQSGSGSQYYGKKSSVMVKVPESVKRTALYAFKLKKLGFRGGLDTGWKRAKQLATKESIPIEDVKYMRAWFARHVYASYPTYKKWIDSGRPKDESWHNKNGIISWLIWSGDSAFRWINSKKILNLLNKHYNKNYKPIKIKV